MEQVKNVHTSLHLHFLQIKFLLCLTKLFPRNKTKIIYPNIKQAFNFHLKIFNYFFLTFFFWSWWQIETDRCLRTYTFPYFQFSPIAKKNILVESKTTNFEIIIMKCSNCVVWVFFAIIAWIIVWKIAFLWANIYLKYLIVRVIKADNKLCLGKSYKKTDLSFFKSMFQLNVPWKYEWTGKRSDHSSLSFAFWTKNQLLLLKYNFQKL